MHHVFPIEYGGQESGLTLPVCGTCHSTIHLQGEAIIDSGDTTTYISEYPDGETRARALLLANQIARAKDMFIASGATKSATARNAIGVHFSNEELSIAHDLKRALGFRSLERMIKHVIIEKWKAHNAGTKTSHRR